MFGQYVDKVGKYEWDFQRAQKVEIPPLFFEYLADYLSTYIDSTAEKKVWKIPNNNLIFPWLTRLFPKRSYGVVIRRGKHLSPQAKQFLEIMQPNFFEHVAAAPESGDNLSESAADNPLVMP